MGPAAVVSTPAPASVAATKALDSAALAAAVEQEAQAWGNPVIDETADGEEIPILDLSVLECGDQEAVQGLARQLQHANENVGFFFITNHGVPARLINEAFGSARRFFDLPDAAKMQCQMGSNGTGYMPFDSKKLPRRSKGNLVEAFIAKREHGPRNITLDSNSWPSDFPRLRQKSEEYVAAMEALSQRLLPLFASALDLPSDFFKPGFQDPLFRLRYSHYPPVPSVEEGRFGIAPHVDTSFFTLLAQEAGIPGLAVATGKQNRWIRAPAIDGALLVNTGELLKQWSNHRVLSTRHFVLPTPPEGPHRYSIAFFYNATADYRMECLPTCHGPENPPKYPPMSYLESQGVAQGE